MKPKELLNVRPSARPPAAVPVPAAPPPPLEPDLLMAPEQGLPLPQGGARRKAVMDLLCDPARERPPRTGGDELCAAPEPAVKRTRLKPRAHPALPLAAPEPELLGESGDKIHRVAVVADIYIVPLRPPRLERASAVPAPRPKSRAECERRCRSDGFCDPSDPLGCGGVHCGRR